MYCRVASSSANKERVQADREASPPGLIRGHPCRECWLSRQDKAAGSTRSSRSVPPTRSFPASLWHMSSRSYAGKWARYVDSPVGRPTLRTDSRRSRAFSPSQLVGLRCHLLGKPAVSAIVARGSSVGQGDGRDGVGVVVRLCMARGDSSALWKLG